MRTTVDLDEDVLMAVKELARLRNKSLGHVLSELSRKAMLGPHVPRVGVESEGGALVARELDARAKNPLAAFGIHPFPYEGGPIPTNELVNRLRDEEGI